MTAMALTVLVGALSVVQSVFGVGLLVLGTPLLLLAGLRFETTLWLLLPASLTVSAMQLATDRRVSWRDVQLVLTTAAPAVVGGLLVTLHTNVAVGVDVPVAALLLASVLIRLLPDVLAKVRDVCRAHEQVVLGVIGLIHGLTNMGGTILPAYAASRHTDKTLIRQTIALAYSVFALTQLGTLAATGRETPGALSGWLMIVAGAVFLTAGRPTFAALSPSRYMLAINTFMVVVAALLLGRRSAAW